jgi:Mce-associated membrane protein
MSNSTGPQSGVVEILDEPIVDDNPVVSAVDEDGAVDSGNAATIEAPKPVRGQRGVSQWIRRRPAKVGLGLLAMLVVASMALASWMYVFQYRPDQQTNPAAEKAVLTAATEGSVALLSYSPDSIDRDLAAAKSHLTGDFLTYYNQFTDQVVKPAAKQKSVKSTAAVARAAVSEMHTDSAAVLLFINQTSTSSERPEPSLIASSVLVTVTNVNGNWLIAKFEPV